MPTRILFKGTSTHFYATVSPIDLKVCWATSLYGQDLPKQMFQGAHFNEEWSRIELLESAESFYKAFMADMPLLAYSYNIRPVKGERDAPQVFTDFKIFGQRYFVKVPGPGRCVMVLDDGKNYSLMGEPVENQIDIRAQKEIITDDGKYRVYKRKIKLHWPDFLSSLIEFLKKSPDESFVLSEVASKPSIMELVRMYEHGMGEGDVAGEILMEMGDEAKKALEEKLKDQRVKKHHPVIEMILEIMFSD